MYPVISIDPFELTEWIQRLEVGEETPEDMESIQEFLRVLLLKLQDQPNVLVNATDLSFYEA